VNEAERAWRTAEFKSELVETKTGNDLRDGLEVKGEKQDTPQDTAQIDPGWTDFTERTEAAADVADEAWQTLAGQGEELALRQAIQVYENAETDQDVIKAGLFAAGTEGYGAFLQTVSEQDGPEYAAGLAQAVSNVLAETSAMAHNSEFQAEMAKSEAANARDAERALQRLAERRGMSPQEVEDVARAYRGATGQPLRHNLLAVMPDDRDAFLGELAIAAEVDEKAERQRAFKASFFAPDTDINSGLVIKGERAGGDLPPAVTDPAYNAHLVEQQVRREDAERAARPSRQSDNDIRRSIIQPEHTDIASGLTDDRGRPTSFFEIAAKDPDSVQNQQARQRERAALKIANLTGARRA